MAVLKIRQARSTIRMLIERINWPVRMVRLQVARKFADVLASPRFRRDAQRIFLGWLKTRRLESEVVSGLAVLSCTSEQYLPKFQELKTSIRQSSILADVMIRNIYGRSIGGWLEAHSGGVPPSFHPDKYFTKYKSAHVPGILARELIRLEDESGLPFMRQWSFEWHSIQAALNVPRPSYPYYFMDWPEYRESGVEGQFSLRQCDVYRSAFLRTLAHAVSRWKMPTDYAAFVALYSLPVNRGLVRVKPIRRPPWLPMMQEQFAGSNVAIKRLVMEILVRARGTRGLVPICIKMPLQTAGFPFGELWIAASFVSRDYAPAENKSPVFERSLPFPLPDEITFEGSLPKPDVARFRIKGSRGLLVPASLDVWPIQSGFWHNDYFQLGLSLPAPYLFSGSLNVQCREKSIELREDKNLVGSVSIWHDDWTPLYPKDGRTRCGLVASMSSEAISRAEHDLGVKLAWYGRLRVWRREKDYTPFNLEERTIFFRHRLIR